MKPNSTTKGNKESVLNFTSSLFKYVDIFLVLGGIYPSLRNGDTSKSRLVHTRLKKVCVLTVILLLLVQVTLHCHNIYNRAKKMQQLTRPIMFLISLSANLFLSLFASFTLPRELIRFKEAITIYGNRYGLNINVWSWIKRIRIITVCFILYNLLACPILVYTMMQFPEIACDMWPLCAGQGFWQYLISIYNILIAFIAASQWLGFFYVDMLFCVFLLQEFKTINRGFKELLTSRSTSNDAESKLDELIDHHEGAVDVLEHASNCVCLYGFFNLFLTIPVNCVFLYSITSKSETTAAEIFFLCIGLGSASLMLGIRLVFEAAVSRKAHGPLQYIWKLRKSVVSDRGTKQLNLFVSRLTGDSIGYNIYGLLTVNMPTLLGIFGTFATYIIVVIQFSPTDAPSQCELLARNISQLIT